MPIVSGLIKAMRCVKFYVLSIVEKNALLLSARAYKENHFLCSKLIRLQDRYTSCNQGKKERVGSRVVRSNTATTRSSIGPTVRNH